MLTMMKPYYRYETTFHRVRTPSERLGLSVQILRTRRPGYSYWQSKRLGRTVRLPFGLDEIL